jgi:cytochrome c-type biogenesis protein CcmH
MSRTIAALPLFLLLAACGTSSTSEPGLSGTVSLDPQLAAQVSPGETVFLFARLPEGPPMPLAIQRLEVRDLPYRFRLDDSHAMTEQGLSSVEHVVVVVRVSRSGRAMPASGDLEGRSSAVPTGATDLRIVIDRVLP